MPNVLPLDSDVKDSAVPSNALEVTWQLAIRWAMRDVDCERALAPHGIYAQSQPEQFLLRAKVSSGRLSTKQMRAIATLIEDLPECTSHLTTRQNLELNYLTPDNLPRALDALAAVGLTARETGGNTVRSVATCALAGVCPSEIFDVRPFANQLAERFQGIGVNSMLPRKFKIALSGCDADCAQSRIQDLGAIAVRPTGGASAFDVYVGGGLGASPKFGEPFGRIAAQGLLPLGDALLRTFQRQGDYERRHRARLKYLVEQAGIEQVKRWVVEESDRGTWVDNIQNQAGWPADAGGAEFQRPLIAVDQSICLWIATNVVVQRQTNRHAVFVAISDGTVSARQWQALVSLCESLQCNGIRITPDQELLLIDVSAEHLRLVHGTLVGVDLAGLGGRAGLAACPGTALCRRAITSSRALAAKLRRVMPHEWQADPIFAGTRIKISGCQNSCARPQIATIGLSGRALYVQGRRSPGYRLFLGGGNVNGQAALGRLVAELPAAHVPDAVLRLLSLHSASADVGESFAAFARRVDGATVRSALAEYIASSATAPADPNDWGADRPLAADDNGEC